MNKILTWIEEHLPFGNPNPARLGIAAFIGVLLFVLAGVSFCHKAKADSLTVPVGSEIIHGQGVTVGLYYRHPLSYWSNSDYPVGVFFGTNLMANDGLGDRNNWAWATGLEGQHGYFHIGIGAAYLANVDRLNGQHANFELYASYRRWAWCPVSLIHFSDAGTSTSNIGRNLLVCEFKLR